jgi:small-conductance mechanosensitive channel
MLAGTGEHKCKMQNAKCKVQNGQAPWLSATIHHRPSTITYDRCSSRSCLVALLAVLAALIAARPAAGQIPLPESGAKSPAITLGAATPTSQKVQEIVAELEEMEKNLLKEQAELIRWKDDTEAVAKRLVELRKMRDKLAARLAKEEKAPAESGKPASADVDPALLPQLDVSIEMMADLHETLTFLTETFRQAQAEVGDGLAEARRLLDLLRNPPPAGPAGKLLLEEILRYMSDLRVSSISLSLLKARRAGLNEELEQRMKEKKPNYPLPELAEWAGEAQSRQTTLSLRDELTRKLAILQSYRKTLRAEVAGHIQAQLARVRLEIYEREEELARLEGARHEVMDALAFGDNDIAVAEERFQAAAKRIADEEKAVRKELKVLRLNPPLSGDGAADEEFTVAKEWQVKLAVLQHRLYLLDVELQVEKFRQASVAALQNLVRHAPPPGEFVEGFAWYMDAERQLKAREELDKRREAWRQEYQHLSLTKPAQGQESLAAAILGAYKQILDLYDQIGARKWEMEWCAELVRYYQDRYEASRRDAWWYAWRSAVSVVMFGAALLFSILLGGATLRPIRRRGAATPNWLRSLLFLSFLGGVIVIWLGLLLVTLTNVWGAVFGIDRVGAVLSLVLFNVGETEVTLLSIGKLIGVIILTVIANRLLARFLSRHIFTYFAWDIGIQHAILAVVKYLVLFGGLALGLEYVGIGLSALALFAGVIGIGIGFGLQNIASNFISGLIILFERPIKKGDFVEAGGLVGQVEDIRARATTLVTRDSVTVIVPNSEFVGGRVVNWSHGSELVRLHIPIGVAYGTDVHLVKRVLVELARGHTKVLGEPGPSVLFTAFADSSLNFELLVWTRDIAEKNAIISDINFAIDAAFREHKIEIPFPQRDLHIRSIDAALPKS